MRACVLTHYSDYSQASQPEGFAERYHTLPATEVDGKDLRTESIRKDNLGKRLTNSSKYGTTSMRWIAWTIPGSGLTTLVTDLFAARVSECELIRVHSKWLMIFPPGGCGVGGNCKTVCLTLLARPHPTDHSQAPADSSTGVSPSAPCTTPI